MPGEQTCPVCQTRLLIRDDAPAVVTCPRCLTPQRNQAWGAAPGEVPRRVIPLEQQVGADTTGINAGLVVLIVMLVIGGLALLSGVAVRGSSPAGLALVCLFALIAIAGVVLIRVQNQSVLRGGSGTQTPSSAEAPPDTGAGGQVLDYRRPSPYLPGEERFSFGRLTLGFFSAVALSAAVFIAMGYTIQANAGIKGVITVVSVGAFIAPGSFAATSRHRSNVRGFGRGVAIGMTMGLIALTPCAGCYLMM